MAVGSGSDGLAVTFQGVVCLPQFGYSRPTGFEPGSGFVSVEVVEWEKFELRSNIRGVNAPASLSTVEKAPQGKAKPAAEFLETAGDLVIRERMGPGDDWTTTFQGVLIGERGVETILATDSGPEFVKVDLSDIRLLWKTRGTIFAWINIPQTGAGLSSTHPTTSDPAGFTTSGATPIEAPSGGSTVSGGVGFKIPPLIPGSLDDDGKPWTLRRTLEARVLPALPGAPKLKRLPPDLDGDGGIPIGHAWDGILPVKALEELLDEFRLVISLNHDASVSLWHEGEGQIEREDPTHSAINYVPGKADSFVKDARDIATPHYTPSTCVVLGPPIRDTTRCFLEAVGELRDPKRPHLSGQVVPLQTALDAIGVSMRTARIYVFADEDEKVLLDVPTRAAAELDRWCFRWFRIPAGGLAHSDWLPIRERGVPDAQGDLALLEPRVWSESVSFAFTPALAHVLGKLGTTSEAKGSISAAAKQLRRSRIMSCAWNLPWEEQSDGYEIDKRRGIVRFKTVQVVAQGLDPPPGAAGAGSSAPSATVPEYKDVVLDEVDKIRGPGFFVRDKKIIAARVDAAIKAANEAAAREVAATKARDAATAGALPFGLLNAIVRRPALVQLEWGWDRKPGINSDIEIFHRYASFWERLPGKAGKPGKVIQRETLDASTAPLTIHRPDLLEVHDADGNTNKAQLDGIARSLATASLSQPEVTRGATVTLCRPVPVATNGRVTSVVYSTDASRPRVVIHLGAFDPLTPPHASTHARVPRYESIRDSVAVPRGGL